MSKTGHRITRTITLDAGHRVPSHQSGCRNLHGHTYKVEAQFTADTLDFQGEAEGMVADFGSIKIVMMEEIHAPCDHQLILYYKDTLLPIVQGRRNIVLENTIAEAKGLFGMSVFGEDNVLIHVVNFIPTAENLAQYWYHRVKDRLDKKGDGFAAGEGFSICSIRVHETPNCYADYSE